MAPSLGLRRRTSWWLALLALLTALLLFLALRVGRRPDSASREPTLTRAEIERKQGGETTGAAGPPCTSHVSCAEGALCTRGHCVSITPRTTECRDAMVRFARGTVELSSHADAAVELTARCLKANHTPALAIEPSSDPSRSAHDNEQLTQTRRAAVRRALEQRGITADRLTEIGLPPE